jgi:hypothetical protein
LEKAKQNQNLILAKGAEGGVKNFSDFKSLAPPTFAKGPIVFQCLFLKLSHRLLTSRHVRFSRRLSVEGTNCLGGHLSMSDMVDVLEAWEAAN